MVSRKPNNALDVDVARESVEAACKDYLRALEDAADCALPPRGPTTVARVEAERATSTGLVVLLYSKRPPLTKREGEIGRLVGQGLGNKGIARELGVGAKTVQKHVEKIKLKWGLSTRAELARTAILELC